VLDFMVEREGLEPSKDLSQINKLRITLKIRTPDFPSNTRIWHSIWHWLTQSRANCWYQVTSQTTAYFHRDCSLGEQ